MIIKSKDATEYRTAKNVNSVIVKNLINCYCDMIEVDLKAADSLHVILEFAINPSPETWQNVLDLIEVKGGKYEGVPKAWRASRTS